VPSYTDACHLKDCRDRLGFVLVRDLPVWRHFIGPPLVTKVVADGPGFSKPLRIVLIGGSFTEGRVSSAEIPIQKERDEAPFFINDWL